MSKEIWKLGLYRRRSRFITSEVASPKRVAEILRKMVPEYGYIMADVHVFGISEGNLWQRIYGRNILRSIIKFLSGFTLAQIAGNPMIKFHLTYLFNPRSFRLLDFNKQIIYFITQFSIISYQEISLNAYIQIGDEKLWLSRSAVEIE